MRRGRGPLLPPCYKFSTIPFYPKERLMRIPPRPQGATQPPLFQSSLKGPRWEQLPSEVQQQTKRLLARMLNEQAERKAVHPSLQEAGDE